MQDYIFNSRRQAARRRRQLLVRLILLLLLVGGVAFLANHFLNSTGDETTNKSENGDLLPLPPVNETLPAQSRTEPEVAAPALVADNDRKDSTETIPEDNQTGRETAVAEDTSTTEAPVDTGTKTNINWVEHTVASGDTLAVIFQQQGLSSSLLNQIVTSSKTARKLARLHPGEKLRFALDENGQLQQLILQRDRITSLEIQRIDKGFSAEEVTRPVETRLANATGIIESSLFLDGQKAGLSDRQIMELAQIFGWDIDFALEIREGDQFHVIYEEQFLDGEKLKNGPILAAEFVNRGKIYKAIRYTDKAGDTAYYDTEGNAKRRAFIRTPVKFGRISSRFTRKRWHPVLKKWRSHKGVDYAAPTGTPVKATGNGKVVFRGKKGGYGNVIFLRHGGKYTTVYGHLSRFAKGLKNGQSVKQGQIIGYVGSTGLATGPHLHYEFRVHGKHQNPLTVKLPKSIRLPKSELAQFKKTTQPLLAKLDELRAKMMVASAH